MAANPNAPNPFASLVITGNATADSAIRAVLLAAFMAITGAILGWLNAHGFHDPNLTVYVPLAVASVLSAGALGLWGVLRTSNIAKITDAEKVVAMNATLGLVASGKAVDSAGNVISFPINNSTPPKLITAETAPEIVKNFAPPANAAAKV